jgi:hypothetical protein
MAVLRLRPHVSALDVTRRTPPGQSTPPGSVTKNSLTGLLGAFNIGLFVTQTALPVFVPGVPESTKYATSFPSGYEESIAREDAGLPFYEACMTALHSGVQFLHLPVVNTGCPLPESYMDRLQRAADATLRAGKGVWLQCYYGEVRSWSAALFVLQRCGPEPRPLDPMPLLRAIHSETPWLLHQESYLPDSFLRKGGPFEKVKRHSNRRQTDIQDVLWLIATHAEARAFVLQDVDGDKHWIHSLLHTHAAAEHAAQLAREYDSAPELGKPYDTAWLCRMCDLARAMLAAAMATPGK